MGLTSFKGARPTLQEAKIAKNYLTEEELFRLNRLVSAFFDLAELKAEEKTPMTMQNWIEELDKYATMYGKGVLQNSGKISRKQAEGKAEKEFRAYEVRTLSPVEQAYWKSIQAIEERVEKKVKNK